MRTRHYDLDANRRMVWRLLLLVLFVELITLFFARRASAEPLIISQSALAAGQSMDTTCTVMALNYGAVERNPLLGASHATPASTIVMKSTLSVLALYATKKLDDAGHHTLARVFNYSGAAAGFVGVSYSWDTCHPSLTLVKRAK